VKKTPDASDLPGRNVKITILDRGVFDHGLLKSRPLQG